MSLHAAHGLDSRIIARGLIVTCQKTGCRKGLLNAASRCPSGMCLSPTFLARYRDPWMNRMQLACECRCRKKEMKCEESLFPTNHISTQLVAAKPSEAPRIVLKVNGSALSYHGQSPGVSDKYLEIGSLSFSLYLHVIINLLLCTCDHHPREATHC